MPTPIQWVHHKPLETYVFNPDRIGGLVNSLARFFRIGDYYFVRHLSRTKSPLKKPRMFGLSTGDCLPAAVGHLNVTSLSVEPSASLQQLAMARQGNYDPLWPHSLS
jgi:hypothetical protein